MKAVFTTKVGSGYDDIVEKRYHFPEAYLNQVRSAVGDSIIYYEPRRTASAPTGGLQAYFAIARVLGIEPDPRRSDRYFARIADYLDFHHTVPFRADGEYFESGLQRDDGGTSKGAFGRAVRNIPDEEFENICARGFAAIDAFPTNEPATGFEEPPQAEFTRPIVEITVSRPFRDRAFSWLVQQAYDRTCAITGLQIINGGGRPEVQAAHIQAVADDGPDSVRNGLALSGTIHWMFDRGLISVADDHRILTSRKIPDRVRSLINPTGYLIVPKDPHFQPHPYYLNHHREEVFKE